MTSYIPAPIFDRAPSAELAGALWDGLCEMPADFRGAILEKYEAEAEKGAAVAIDYLTGAVEKLSGAALALSASDEEICAFAAERAGEVRSLMMATAGATTAAAWIEVLTGYCRYHRVNPPPDLLAGMVARMTSAAWWRRQIRRTVAREVEAAAIELGFVHRRGQMYASDETVERRRGQLRRNAKALEETEAENETGYRATLAELSAKSVSNPDLRRGELMTRIRGFEEFAQAAGDIGMFYTWTCPARMHAGKPGQKRVTPYDGTTPKQAAGYLSKQYAKFRAWLSRKGIFLYGFRVAEPHSDGCPHWHLLLFMRSDVEPTVTDKMRAYAWESDAGELTTKKARSARFKAIKIDPAKGSASGYISKYIVKNIDGSRGDGQPINKHAAASAERVRAWASCWGIRQFQQIGGPGVTIWRELRRVRELAPQHELFPYWQATDKQGEKGADWGAFVARMGGISIRRANRPVQLYKEDKPETVDEHGEIRPAVNQYGEPAGSVIRGVFRRVAKVRRAYRIMNKDKRNSYVKGYDLPAEITDSAPLITRVHTWTINKPALEGKAIQEKRGRIIEREGKRRENPEWAKGKTWAEAYRELRGFPGLASPKGAQPWTRVNNCTPHAPHWWTEETETAASGRDMDGFRLGEFKEAAKTPPKYPVLEVIAARRKLGAFGKFPAPPGERGRSVTGS